MKKFLLVVLFLLVIVAVVGLLLPRNYSVEESIDIHAKPAAIHALVSDLKRWDEWTPWKEVDPSVQVTLGKETQGVGASQTWIGKEGKGSLTVTRSDVTKGVEFDMTFDKTPAKSGLRYEPKGETTTVTWWMKGEIDMPVIGSYFALVLPKLIGKEYRKGLSKLKEQSEKP